MEPSNITLAYFSATFTTRKILRLIAEQMNNVTAKYDITNAAPEEDILLKEDDLLIMGAPVYAGRIPAQAATAFNKFKGNNTPAIIVCVYGNRDYDDALLEMKDIAEQNGFKVISAAAFIAQHSIFPTLAENRPDEQDKKIIAEFANQTIELLQSTTDIASLPEIKVKGNRPYKVASPIPLKPKGNRKCDKCGTCARQCPVQAISEDSPRRTDKEKCISCGRCIVVCPQKARSFGGILYKMAGNKLIKANMERKRAEVIINR